jgi:glycosidase
VFVEPPGGPAGLQPTRRLDDVLLYHLMVDRFRGPQGALPAPASPGLRAGGTLSGVRAAVEAGYFTRLGVTTLWLSPLYENPPGLHRGRDGNLYEAYHGYWPSAPRSVEPQLGDAAELSALVAAAHQRGLRLLFDAVPNHVYESHPYYAAHSRAALTAAGIGDLDRNSWFNDGPRACVCGDPGCDWGTRIEDCWFDSYLPDLNWRHPDVMQTGVADLLYWLAQFDLDGMRIDAVPMMPRAASRRMVRGARDSVYRAGMDLLIVGEDYTGPGDGGRSEIRSFLGSHYDGLPSAFDFPLMWATRSALAGSTTGLDDLAGELDSSDRAFAGSGAVMAHILDNHDTPRFISEAAGNAGNDPWRDPPPQPTDSAPYQRQLLGLTLLLTLPGLPVLYYGDEIGLAGANDPDARRPLPDVLAGALPRLQADLLEKTGRLGQLRTCLPALRRGSRQTLAANAEWLVTLQTPPASADPAEPLAPAGDPSPALVVLARLADSPPHDPADGERRLFVSRVPVGTYRDVLSGDLLTVPSDTSSDAPGLGTAALTLKPLTAAVYVRADSACQPKF